MIKTRVLLGICLVVLLCGSEATPYLIHSVRAYVPPPRTTTGLKELVKQLMAATPTALRIDSDNDTLYDCVEHVIGTDPNNADTDFDLLDDYTEVMIDSDPLDPDTNSDGLSDYMEVTNVTSLDLDRDNSTNVWDYDNDGDGVNDGIDLSPFAKSTQSDVFHFDVSTNGKPTYINLQFRPKNPENLKLYAQIWDWPNDTEGIMKDLDGSRDDVKVIPQLNVTVNICPNQTDVAEFGILVTDYGIHVPVYPVWENDEVVAFSATIFYNSSSPLSLSMDARLMWRVLGSTDEKAKALQASNGKYVSVGSDGALVADASGVSLLETFQWLDVGENKTALKVHDGPYITVTDSGSVVALGSDIGAAQTFELVDKGNLTCLKAYNGKYVSATSDGTLVANSSTAENSTTFLVLDQGCLSDWTILVTYKEPYTLTGFTVSESYGCNLGLFYSADREQTIQANLLLGNDFLRNSTTPLQDMPAILAGYGVYVSSVINGFSIQEEALTNMSNTMLPDVLDSLPPNQTLPVIICVEENRTTVEMSELASGSFILGSSCSVDLNDNVEMITSKSLKTNFYETTGYKALEIDAVLRDIATWPLSEQARFSLSNLMLAWNTGEQTITRIGLEETAPWMPPEWVDDIKDNLEVTLTTIDTLDKAGTSIRAYTWLSELKLKGWNSASLARWLKTGGDASNLKLWTALVKKINTAKESFAGIKGLKTVGDIMDGLAIVGFMVDVGMSILTAAMLSEQVGGHLGQSWAASFAIVSISYTLIYTAVLMAIGEIPYVGPILVLALVLADIFGGFSDWLSDLFMDWFGPDDLSVVEPWLEEIGIPEITFDDKDGNGFDVGDRVTITLTTKSKVNVTSGSELQWAWSSWYRPYISIAAPSGSHSNTSQTGVPPVSEINTTYGVGWKTEESETGAWIEPGVGMPNFPVTVNLNVNYKLYHVWEHFVFYLVYWEWCRHEDVNQGVTSSHLFTTYYDVLPENIDDFRTWRGITPLDHDYDGLADVNETRSNPYKYDSDGDGLNDKFEMTIGTDPSGYDTDRDGLIDSYEVVFGTNSTNPDTDGDGLPDYLELAGWVIPFNYTGDPTKSFTMRVFSDPRVADTDGDGVNDYVEYWSDLNPRSKDTDGDGVQDVANPKFLSSDLNFVDSWEIPLSVEHHVHGIAVDTNGYVYVTKDQGYDVNFRPLNDSISKFDSSGTLVSAWPGYYEGAADQIAADNKNGYLYIADGYHVHKYYLNGTYIESFANHNYPNYIRAMTVDVDGYIYVGGSYYEAATPPPWPRPEIAVAYVEKYDPNGTMISHWGSYGAAPDQITSVDGLAVDADNGYIYLSDNGSYGRVRDARVAKFDTAGNYLTNLNPVTNYSDPSGMAVDADGCIYIVDTGNNCVLKFNSDGMFLASWGNEGYEDGNFSRPVGIAVGSDGYVYVVDEGGSIQEDYGNRNGRVQKFSQVAEEKPPFDDPVPDRDGDGLNNAFEIEGWNATFVNATGAFTIHVTSDPMINDTDADGLTDFAEFNLGTNPRSPDTDGDGVSDLAEYQWHHSLSMNPANYDTDGDGLDDGAELSYGSDPTKPDTDGDGLTDLQEFQLDTNANKVDTDGDGLSDRDEVLFGSDPTSPDSDGDLAFDGSEFSEGTDPRSGDTDHDGLLDGHELILETNPLNSDTDGDNLTDGFEVKYWLNPRSNDTDGDGLSDSTELQKGTDPWNSDSDHDGIPDGEDQDSNSTQVPNIVLAFDADDNTKEFADNLAKYTNVTTVSKEQLLANYTDAPCIVLVGNPDGNGTIGKLVHDILLDSGEVLTNMMESDTNRFAVRYGLWNATQTIVTLSTPYPSDYVRVLDILRSKIVTILPDSAEIRYNTSLAVEYPKGGSLNHTSITCSALSVDEIDTLKATDATLTAVLTENSNVSFVKITNYNAANTPHPLMYSSPLKPTELAMGSYVNVTVGNDTGSIEMAILKIYYHEVDLDRTGNGLSGDMGDVDENSLIPYVFDETSQTWKKPGDYFSGAIDFGVNAADVEVYGEKYAGYVWVQAPLGDVSFFGLAGLPLTLNRPPDVSNAYPNPAVLWPPNKKMVPVTIEGVTDPDGDAVTITVTSIANNQPADNGIDWDGVGTDTAWLRADRLGKEGDRVYTITFMASDGNGGNAVGTVSVLVPHDMSKKTPKTK